MRMTMRVTVRVTVLVSIGRQALGIQLAVHLGSGMTVAADRLVLCSGGR